MYYNGEMRKIDFLDLIPETVAELKATEKIQANARLRLRVQFLRLLKSGQAAQLKQAAELIGITPKHASVLWKKYRKQGLARLLELDYRARTPRLSSEQTAQLMDRAAADGFGSQRQAKEYLAAEFGYLYTQQGVSVMFGRLKIKAKVPRPQNVQAVPEEAAAYKKTLPDG